MGIVKPPSPEELKKLNEVLKQIKALDVKVKGDGLKVKAAAAVLTKGLDAEKDE